jgi:4-hydroxybenzoate polyprenyltransferase
VFDWFSRYRERQRDLAAGVDADLIASNRKKTKIALVLLGLGLLLLWIAAAESHGTVREILRWLGGTVLSVGFFVAVWDQQERAFLNKPDPKKPPSLFK